MRPLTTIVVAVLTATFLTMALPASAQDRNLSQRSYVTFNKAVQMPGLRLEAGTYLFQLAQTEGRNVIQIFDRRQQHFFGQWFYLDTYRTIQQVNAANGKPVIVFRETPQGVAPAIRSFFYPTDLIGKEFIYSEEQIALLARAPQPPPQPAVVAQPQPAATTGTENEQPTGTASGSEPSPPAQPEPPAPELPKTASTVPALGLAGLISLVGGFALRFARHAQ